MIILAVGAASAPYTFSTTLDRFAELEGGIFGSRQAVWQGAWQFIRDHPLGGAGLGNTRIVMMSYLEFPSFSIEGGLSTHNPPLAVWSESGIPGLLLYLGVLGSALWRFFQEYFRCKSRGLRSHRAYFALVSSVFLGYMVSWIKGGGMEAHFTYFLMLALLLIPSQLDQKELEGDVENEVGRGWPSAISLDQRPGLPS